MIAYVRRELTGLTPTGRGAAVLALGFLSLLGAGLSLAAHLAGPF